MSEELKPTDGITVLPDGSAFATASWPLPKDHWLYAPRGEWDNVRDDFAETPLPILTNAQLDAVIAAGRYAVRGATMCGQEQDFDPDALVQNLCYALCGPANATLLPCDAPAQPEPAAPTPDTFMGEPVLTRWKPLNRDDSRLALHQSMHNRSFGNPSDDKLMLEWLWESGYALCKRVPTEAAPTVVEPVDDVAYHELTDAECDEFRRHRGDFNSMLRSVHSDGHYRHAGRLIAHLGAVFNERFDRAIAATPPRAALTDADIDSATANRRDALLDHIEEYGTTSEGVRPLVRQLARAVIAADRGGPK